MEEAATMNAAISENIITKRNSAINCISIAKFVSPIDISKPISNFLFINVWRDKAASVPIPRTMDVITMKTAVCSVFLIELATDRYSVSSAKKCFSIPVDCSVAMVRNSSIAKGSFI